MQINEIALEDLVTIVCTEFLKITDRHIIHKCYPMHGKPFTPYLKMSMKQRRKISEKILDSLGI